MQLTPNRRLAAYLIEKNDQEVYPFSHWIETLWNKYPEKDRLLLTPIAQQILWERIIRKSRETYPLLNIAPMAKMAMEAWALCHQWEVPMRSPHWQRSDHSLFLTWAQDFQAECEANHWIDNPLLSQPLLKALENAELSLPDNIECIGFQEWNPQEARWFDRCRSQGISVNESSLLKQRGDVFQLAAGSQEEELRLAALYAEQVLENNPNASFGIVIPDLEQRRFEVLRILEDHLKPSQFNVSAPISLTEYPLVEAAILGIRLLENELTFEEWSKFLRLPFFGKAVSEMSYCAQLDVLFRAQPRPSIFSIELFSSIITHLVSKLPNLSDFELPKILSKAIGLREAVRKKQSTEEWAALFTEMLLRLQWPGERSLTRLEALLKNQWNEILKDYVGLGYLLGKHGYLEAIHEIQRLCRQKKFLPPSEKAPIQVLGLLEGLGLPFDYLWVLGLHRETWPKEPAPHPFIPLSLQRSLGLPRSSPKRELQMALKITEQLSWAAPKVIFSYPQMIEDSKISISPLLSALPMLNEHTLNLSSWYSVNHKLTDSGGSLKPNRDPKESAPTLQRGEKLKSGARLLKLQSACPFRAFAEIRLNARPLGREQWGLNSAERGEILHQILNLFWKGLGSQSDLISLGHNACEQRIKWAVHSIFSQWERDHRYRLQPRYFSIEQERAVRLVRQFIELERSRPPFEVLAHEIEETVILKGMPLKLRIDRIDRLETGEEILIDYKTGKTNIADWFGERPVDPQLPLYCIARKPSPSGVALALIRSDQIKYRGFAEKLGYIPGILSAQQLKRYDVAENMADQINRWQAQLESLANEFMTGRAEVAPYAGEQTCRSCHLKSLCRVGEGS